MAHISEIYYFNNLKKRIDILVYKKKQPFILIECKSSNIFSKKVFDQIIKYNFYIKSYYLLITNWINNIIFKIDLKNNRILFFNEIPINL
ncbi:MAG: type I restriction enzyme HsdR N-terminal domain-containing protein [Candidatus Karelsulcia muelleri]